MAADLREQLQHTLSGSYTLERELGGGGMSRVFIATETSLGRKVVIKVLPPDLGEGVSVERFKREIQLAAQLTHPHIVPVHAAGETNGLPYYTMPLVDGFSLRTRLGKEGALSVTEVVGYLRDVAKALAYAHDHGVVHRDIKPDNVLITGGSAVVTDFGIAKAIAAARTGPSQSTLTQLGASLGTPAYMAPEQAAADPGTDHRADIYAFGVMAFELLAGRPPFHGRSPQRLLAAQMSEKPQDIMELRGDTPALLAELVMRCLQKDADQRPQTARDLVKALENVTSGGGHPVMPEILLGGRPRLARALALWAAATVVVTVVMRAAIIAIGLPDWVVPGAIVVMALGLPVILLTYFVHRGAHQALTSAALTPGGSTPQHSTLTRLAVRASPHVSWRRTTVGGVSALAAFILLVAGFMMLRAMGVGPVGSLMAKGTLQKNERILVAEFRSTGGDTSLAPIVTEAFRTGLGQSRSVMVMPATSVRDVLRRMQRNADAPVDFNLAREIATREGIKAFVDGEVLSVGGRYSLSVRLTATNTGETLAAFQETAENERDILTAIDRLTRRLRERIGESLRDIRDAQPLEQVTTPSLEALRKYVQGYRALSFDGDFDKGVALLEEAIAIDTGFAMAYRKLAIEYGNRGGQIDRVMQLLAKAYQHRDRLGDGERYLTIAAYFQFGPQQDPSRAISAYETLLDQQPNHVTALNNLGVQYRFVREFRKAQEVLARAEVLPDAPAVVFNNLIAAGIALGDTAQAFRAIRHLESQYGRNAFSTVSRISGLYGLGRRDSAYALAQELQRARGSDPAARAQAALIAGIMSVTDGRLAAGRRHRADAWKMQSERGVLEASLEAGLSEAWLDGWHRGDLARARRTLDRTLAEHPITALPHPARPYVHAVAVLAMTGRADQAKTIVALFDRDRRTIRQSSDDRSRHLMLGDIALAEGRQEDAIREYREADTGPCVVCTLPRLGRAYDLAGSADSAIAAFTRYVETGEFHRLAGPPNTAGVDGDYLAASYKRLGELWEQKGDRQKALGYYLKFLDLWKNADPELQPMVAAVRGRVARLKDTEAK